MPSPTPKAVCRCWVSVTRRTRGPATDRSGACPPCRRTTRVTQCEGGLPTVAAHASRLDPGSCAGSDLATPPIEQEFHPGWTIKIREHQPIELSDHTQTGTSDTAIDRCCWRPSWNHSATAGLAARLPTGSTPARQSAAARRAAYTTRSSPSRTSGSTHRARTSPASCAADRASSPHTGTGLPSACPEAGLCASELSESGPSPRGSTRPTHRRQVPVSGASDRPRSERGSMAEVHAARPASGRRRP